MDLFGVGVLELLVILVVAMLVLGPEQMPRVAQKLGSIVQSARATVAETRDTFLQDLNSAEPGAADGASEQHGHGSVNRRPFL